MSEYRLDCECGADVLVTTQNAGSTVGCTCGRVLQVPSLSQLRRAAGQPANPLSVVQQVNLLINSGELPIRTSCPLTGLSADDELWLHIQCERVMVRDGDAGWWRTVFFLLLFGWIWLFVRNARREEYGHDISLIVPVAINSQARSQASKMRTQQQLLRLLVTTPIYSQLMQEYPAAQISIATASDIERAGHVDTR